MKPNHKNLCHELLKSCAVRTQRLAIVLLLLCSLGLAYADAQSPSPQPDANRQDGRGVGINTNAPQTTSSSQTRTEAFRPSLVLQTGQTMVSSIIFSPDGRLVASIGMGSKAIKLWDVATGRQLRSLEGHSKDLNSIAFSRDGRVLASGSADNTIKLWDTTTGRELRTLVGHTPGEGMSTISSVAFHPNGNVLASANSNSEIKLWEVATGRELRSIPGHFTDLTFSPDGRELAAVDYEYKVKIWDPMTGREQRDVSLPDNPNEAMMKQAKQMSKNMMKDMMKGGSISNMPNMNPGSTAQQLKTAITYSADGRLLVLMSSGNPVAGGNNSLSIWDVNAKRKPQVLAGYSDPALGIALSPDGRWLASGGGNQMTQKGDNKVRLWDVAAGREARAMAGHNSTVQALVFSPDGRTLASGSMDSTIKLWDAATGREIQTMTGRSNDSGFVAFSPDGNKLISGGKTFWDIATGRGLRNVVAPAERDKFSVMSRDGRVLAVSADALKLYDVGSARELHTLGQPDKSVQIRATFSPDGRVLASTYTQSVEQRMKGPETFMQSIMAEQGAQMETLRKENKTGIGSILGLPSFGRGKDKDAKDAQEQANKAMQNMQNMMRNVRSPANTRMVKLWDVATGSELRTLPLDAQASAVAFSPDSRLLATGIGDFGQNMQLETGTANFNARIKLWDVATGQETRTITTNAFMIDGLAFSPDGRLLAVGCTGYSDKDVFGSVKLYDVTTGRELRVLTGHTMMVWALAFSPDGRALASGDLDARIKLWDVATGQLLHNLAGHDTNITSVAFNSDGRMLVSSSLDTSTRLWDIKTGRLLATLMSLGDGSDWLVATPDGLFDGSPAAWNQILWRFSENIFDVRPVESFFNEFYYPGLLADIVAGKNPKAPQDISQKDRRQPELTLTLADAQAASGNVAARDLALKINITQAPAGAQDVRLFRNGSLVKAWRSDVLKGQTSATLEVTVPIIAGENRLSAYAFNRDNVKSTDATLTINGADSLKRTGTAYVLAIGVNAYANPQYDLKYAVADAEAFGEEVRRQQTRLGRYERVEVIPLLDAEATKANILAALKRLAAGEPEALAKEAPQILHKLKATQPEDAVVVYFAGHGTAQQQRFYLIPHDLGYNGERTKMDAAGLQALLTHSISDEELEQAIEGVDAGQLLLVIDACNSGQALEAEEKRRGPMNSKGLAQLAYEKGMYILTAAQGYQAALEAAQLGHGYLTYALVEEGLKTAAADTAPKDSQVMAREWLDYATERVPQMQEAKMKQARDLGLEIAFVEGEQKIKEPEKRSVQRPRVFYRRELESQPLIVAKP